MNFDHIDALAQELLARTTAQGHAVVDIDNRHEAEALRAEVRSLIRLSVVVLSVGNGVGMTPEIQYLRIVSLKVDLDGERTVADYSVTIRTVEDDGVGEDRSSLVVDHHLAGRAELEVERFSGGHLLHLAIAGCLFNDILREARAREIPIDSLSVSATGGFDERGSTGITYEISVQTGAERGEVERLVADMEGIAAIPEALRVGTSVERRDLRIMS